MMPNVKEEDELYQGYLAKVYQDAYTFQDYTEDEKSLFRENGICITYGELLYPSVKKLIRFLSKEREDVFLDLGSGLAKCALQVYMQTDLKKVMGIEASKPLHDQAILATNKVKSDFPIFWEENRDLNLVYGNFLNSDWEDATIIYTCSTCFTLELLINISAKINKHQKIKQVFSFRPLPFIRLPLKKVFIVECSWDSALCFYYSLRR